MKEIIDNVIGPIPIDEWKTLKMLKRSLRFMKNSKDQKFADAIEKETRLYNFFLDPYINQGVVHA